MDNIEIIAIASGLVFGAGLIIAKLVFGWLMAKGARVPTDE